MNVEKFTIAIFKEKLTLLFLVGLFISYSSVAQTTFPSYTTAGTYTWTCPCGVTSVVVECWGAGGGGGGAAGNQSNAGAGGGGAYARSTVAVTAGSKYIVTVGQGGSAGLTTPTNGGNGTASSFILGGVSVISDYGRGGSKANGTNVYASPGAGGTVGGCSGSGSSNQFYTGGNGCPAPGSWNTNGTGGGGGAGNGGAGQDGTGGATYSNGGSGGIGSAAGGTPAQAGGIGGSGMGGATAESGYSIGGGGGGARVNSTSHQGGDGADGAVIITSVATVITASAGSAQGFCAGNSVTIGGSPTASGGTSPYTYSWSPAGGLSATNIANPVATPGGTTTYTVTVTDHIGCTATASVALTITAAGTNTFVGAPGGNWSTGANWSLGYSPVSCHDVIIPNGTSVVADINATVNSIDIRGSGQLLMNVTGVVINVNGTFTMESTSILQSNPNNATPGTVVVGAAGSFVVASNANWAQIQDASITVNGSTFINGGLRLSSSTSGNKFMSTTTIAAGATLNYTTNETIDFQNSNVTCSGTISSGGTGFVTNINNFIVPATQTCIVAGTKLTVNNQLQVSGTFKFTSTAGTHTFNGGIIVNAGGTFNNVAGESYNVGGNIQNDGTWVSPGGNSETVTMTPSSAGNASYSITGSQPIYFWRLTVNNNGGGNTTTSTLTNTLTLQRNTGSCLTGTGTFNMGINGYLHLTGGTAGSDPVSVTTFGASTASNTVEYDQAANQTIHVPNGSTYNNLTLSNGSTKTTAGALLVSGILYVKINTTLSLANNIGNSTVGPNPSATNLETQGGQTGSIISGGSQLYLGGDIHIIYQGGGAVTTGALISSPMSLVSGVRAINVDDGGVVASTSEDIKVSCNITNTNPATLNKTGNGKLTLSGNNNYQGGTNLNAGTLNINSTNALGNSTGVLAIASGTTIDNTTGGTVNAANYPMNWNGDFTYAGTRTLNFGTGAVAMSASRQVTCNVINAGATLIVQGVISGVGFSLTKAGAGALTLSGANSFNGGTNLNAGTLNINSANALGTSAGTFTIAGGTTINNTLGGPVTTVNYPMAWNGDFTFTGTNALNLGAGAITMSADRQITASASTLTVGGVINDNTKSLTKAGAGTLSFVGQAITLKGLTISAGILTSTSGVMSLAGNFSNSGTFTHNSGTVIFNGSVAQTLTGATTFNNFTINNTFPVSGLTLNSAITVSGTLNLADGHIITTSGLLTMGAGSPNPTLSATPQDSSFIKGPMARVVNVNTANTWIYPIGSGNDYRRLDVLIDQTPATSTTYTAQMINSSAKALGYTLPGTLTKVSGMRYYTITQSAATALDNAQVTAYFQCAQNSDVVNDLTHLSIAQWNNATAWLDRGGTAAGALCNATDYAGTVQSNGFTTFTGNIFTLANKSGGVNALPVELLNFEAHSKGTEVDVTWQTVSENNNNYFTVEKSQDGKSFQEVAKVEGAGSSNTLRNYETVDTDPFMGLSYYRLKQTDLNGDSRYFNVVPVQMDVKDNLTINVSPDPAAEINEVNIKISGKPKSNVLLVLRDVMGKEYFSKAIVLDNGTYLFTFDNAQPVSPGIYFIVASSNDTYLSKKIVIK